MHFLDELPFSLANPASRELRDLLARHIRKTTDIEALSEATGLPLDALNWDQPARHLWADVLREARAQSTRSDSRIRELLRLAVERVPALAERLRELLRERPVLPAEGAATIQPLPGAAEPERILGERSTLLDVAWLDRGAEVARGVGRLLVSLDNSNPVYGTGFLVGPRTVLTNRHVLTDPRRPVTGVEFWLSYENDARGKERVPVICRGVMSSIRVSGEPTLDWAAIDLETPPDPLFTRLSLRPSAPPRAGDHVAIVQHPGGQRKMIGVLTNLVVGCVRAKLAAGEVEAYLQYLTDTEPGSSGSPVFNDRWEVVALHYASEARPVKSPSEPPFVNQGVLVAAFRDELVIAEG